jgi:hypothetical protein
MYNQQTLIESVFLRKNTRTKVATNTRRTPISLPPKENQKIWTPKPRVDKNYYSPDEAMEFFDKTDKWESANKPVIAKEETTSSVPVVSQLLPPQTSPTITLNRPPIKMKFKPIGGGVWRIVNPENETSTEEMVPKKRKRMNS